jgi:hypothetical protein
VRGGLDAWLPLKLGPVPVGLGLSATYARAEQGLAVPGGPVGALVQWVPLTLRAGLGLVDTPLFSLHLGGGGALAYGQMRVTPGGRETFESRLGPMGFLSGALSAGPGQLFLEVSYSHLPLFSSEFFLQAGGAAVDLGYRVAVF